MRGAQPRAHAEVDEQSEGEASVAPGNPVLWRQLMLEGTATVWSCSAPAWVGIPGPTEKSPVQDSSYFTTS